jgi:DNA helicase II / ATP-dependent DNA helicase PcrA
MAHHSDVEEALSAIGHRDHSITAEYRIFGPPGTGKTTNLIRQIRRAVQRFGKDSVLVTSFSRAAAAELAGQDLPVSSDRVGTLHSHCWHALGRPRIAEVYVEEWNRENPHLRITPAKKDRKLDSEESDEDLVDVVRGGDFWLGELNRSRGRMRSINLWPAELLEFAAKWSCYKTSNRLMDFCDLIETAVREIRIAPKRPDVVFADEAQDLNPMQLALVRRWGENTQYFIIAADDDQTIYSWCGATPDAVLDPEIPEDHKIILKESHRVPRHVHARANRLIHQVTRRQEKVYDPRPEDGICVDISRGGYKSPEHWILKTIMQHLENGQKVMLLASCSYMLHPVIAVLRQWGIPFHNPYRKSAGFWNPLRRGRKGSSTNRTLSLLGDHPWTHSDLKLWAEWLSPKGNLRTGARELIEASDDSLPVTAERLSELFEAAALESLLAASGDPKRLLQWWARRVAPAFHARVQFPVAAAMVGGPDALEESPRVIVGTIHSVKGGQADVVFLFPDVSPAGDAAYQKHGPQRDSVIRLFYVGMTRARHTLYVCQRESPLAVTI